MKLNSKTIILILLAALVLMWGLSMSDGDKSEGYSDETNYFSKEELEARQETIEQMAQMRGETPPPTATPEPEPVDPLEEKFPGLEMTELTASYTISRVGYEQSSGTLVTEFAYTGQIFAYLDVPQEEYERFMAADDLDRWFEVMIKDKYKFEHIK